MKHSGCCDGRVLCGATGCLTNRAAHKVLGTRIGMGRGRKRRRGHTEQHSSTIRTQTQTQTQTRTQTRTQTQTQSRLIVCLFVCFIASQYTLNQLRLQQYTTPTVYVSSKLPSPHCPALHKSHTLCRLSLYPYTRVTCVMVEDCRARA